MKRSVSIISVPFDSAHFNKRMGAGPLHIIDNGLINVLEAAGNKVLYTEIARQEKFPTEIATSFKLLDLLRSEVEKAIKNQSFPVVLSGNCSATVGVVAGLKADDIAIIWFDSHGDCETPATTVSGFLDGMGIAMLLNKSWQNLLSLYDLNSSLTGKKIILAGARDLSQYEEEFIVENGITKITVDEIRERGIDKLKTACAELIRSGTRKIHLHIDVDVIDPSVAPSNSYAVENGLDRGEIFSLINSCINEIPVASATIASYDPAYDANGKMLDIINELIEKILRRTLNKGITVMLPCFPLCSALVSVLF